MYDDPVTHAERNSLEKVSGVVAGIGPVGTAVAGAGLKNTKEEEQSRYRCMTDGQSETEKTRR